MGCGNKATLSHLQSRQSDGKDKRFRNNAFDKIPLFTDEKQSADDIQVLGIQGNKRKWVVTRDLWSVCMLAAGPNNPLISFCYDFLAEYWKNEIAPIAYLMTDCIIGIGYEEVPIIKKLIDEVPDNNTHCFDFLTNFREEPADMEKLKTMSIDTYVYQLSYKYNWNERTNSK